MEGPWIQDVFSEVKIRYILPENYGEFAERPLGVYVHSISDFQKYPEIGDGESPQKHTYTARM
ncbi:hypothetical protein ANCDUO_09554 [Ancylostoma duodenale]|uniref:Uncharacterized protein n=1 Tax=Ancylostoma duodenale TaxID=51022 RepID=A0A0C2DCN5_9BILA|nr:hypothetical protein ANCDUO_09554 [Ancylostoma duodenale]